MGGISKAMGIGKNADTAPRAVGEEEKVSVRGCSNKKVTGLAALVAGLILVLFAGLLAGGLFGAGNMYFAAAFLGVASIPAFIIAGLFLRPQPGVSTLGHRPTRDADLADH